MQPAFEEDSNHIYPHMFSARNNRHRTSFTRNNVLEIGLFPSTMYPVVKTCNCPDQATKERFRL